ncbi:hypothetical protein HY065_03500 [Candidatus Berkelbacteria bacterium]|nr:hypothetical protein [Candidatus Berkelbacteria bacterium]
MKDIRSIFVVVVALGMLLAVQFKSAKISRQATSQQNQESIALEASHTFAANKRLEQDLQKIKQQR